MKIPKRLEPLLEDGLIDGVERPAGKPRSVVRCATKSAAPKVYKKAKAMLARDVNNLGTYFGSSPALLATQCAEGSSHCMNTVT